MVQVTELVLGWTSLRISLNNNILLYTTCLQKTSKQKNKQTNKQGASQSLFTSLMSPSFENLSNVVEQLYGIIN